MSNFFGGPQGYEPSQSYVPPGGTPRPGVGGKPNGQHQPGFGDPDLDVIAACAALGQTLTVDDICEQFNRKFAITKEGSSTWVVEFIRDEVFDNHVRLNRQNWANFALRFCHRIHSIQVRDPQGKPKVIAKSWAEWWRDHVNRRQYDRVVFEPGSKQRPNVLNLWQGWGVTPAAGDWSLFQSHLLEVVCSGNATHYNHLLFWLARMVQHPEQPAESAVVLAGLKGTGKGVVGRYLLHLCGPHGRPITSAEQLTGRFNGHLRDCFFVFADEAFFAGDKRHERILKPLITEPVVMVEAKYQDAVSVRNMLHLIMASNEDWVVPASHDERRYFVLRVSGSHANDRTYFAALDAQMEAGGLAAMLYDLLAMDLSGHDHRHVPDTDALAGQKVRSLADEDRWLLDLLTRGYVLRSEHAGSELFAWTREATNALLYASYLQWCDDHKITRRKDLAVLGKHLSQYWAPHYQVPIGGITGEARFDGAGHGHILKSPRRENGRLLGDLDEARQRFADVRRLSLDDLNL